jgi:EAL domain-containing protein (putative c-di-GMP-specific phosphodiesterase class I)
MNLFGTAARFDLVDELERACRRQVFVDWEHFGSPTRLFVNTVPATVRDVSFLGAASSTTSGRGSRLRPSPSRSRRARSSRT